MSHKGNLQYRVPLIALGMGLLLAGLPSASNAQAPNNGEWSPKDGVPADAKAIIDKAFGALLKFNADSAQAFGLVKAAIKLDPFALAEALASALTQQEPLPSITVLQARDEILAEMRTIREEELNGRSESLLSRFAMMLDNPRSPTTQDRLANYIDDATDLYNDLHTIMVNGDAKRAEFVTHLVPTYATVTSSLIVGMSLAGYIPETIVDVYANAINTNLGLVSDDDQYGGYLYGYTVGQYRSFTCCQNGPVCYSCDPDAITGDWVCVSHELVPNDGLPRCADPAEGLLVEERRRIDGDPLIYFIRRTVTDQQIALL